MHRICSTTVADLGFWKGGGSTVDRACTQGTPLDPPLHKSSSKEIRHLSKTIWMLLLEHCTTYLFPSNPNQYSITVLRWPWEEDTKHPQELFPQSHWNGQPRGNIFFTGSWGFSGVLSTQRKHQSMSMYSSHYGKGALNRWSFSIASSCKMCTELTSQTLSYHREVTMLNAHSP